ncbi:MAG: chain length determinant family protein, partial [Colwellia sp.]|nr:chain length determinant family protein [Colwellia sp.]
FGLFSNKVQTNSSVATSYDGRISQLEEQLDELQLRYTDNHPDVKQLKGRIESLNKQRTAEIESYYASMKEAGVNSQSSMSSVDKNPVYQEMKVQVNSLENEAASLNVRVNNYRQRVQELESKIHTLPEIEAELVALNRGYEITKAKYEDLLSRKETAQLAQQADETTDKIQFRVIDPPRAAAEPSGPARFVFFGLVAVLGIGVGIGLSLLMSQLTPIATSTTQLNKATGVPVFGVVSANQNLGLQKWHKRKTLIFIGSNLLLLCLLMMFMSYFLFPDAIQAPLKRIF